VNKKGFTLIEVLVGLVILGIGLLAIAGMNITSVRGNFFSNNLTEGTCAAKDGLETLMNLSYDHASLQPGSYPDGNTQIPGSGIVFGRSYTVTLVDPPGYKRIVYTVTWNDGTSHSATFSTVRSQ
jgi:prepilin-type N-terminal cleavage/methylation domain-containing protein